MLEEFNNSEWTLANREQDFTEWHKGRPKYYFWAIPVDQSQWIESFHEAGKYLQDYLVSNYRRQPHITVLPAGFNRPWSLNNAAILRVAHKYKPFRLELCDLGSFTSCPFLGVHDPSNSLQKLRRDLKFITEDPGIGEQEFEYCPHITVGLYDDIYSTRLLTRLMQQCRLSPVDPILVTKLVLARYQSSDICGPIEIVEEINLGTVVGPRLLEKDQND